MEILILSSASKLEDDNETFLELIGFCLRDILNLISYDVRWNSNDETVLERKT